MAELALMIRIDTGPNAARKFARRFDRSIRNLADFPELGRLRPDVIGSPRSLSLHPWILFYEPLQDRKGIRVLRVIDGRRDIEEVLGKIDP